MATKDTMVETVIEAEEDETWEDPEGVMGEVQEAVKKIFSVNENDKTPEGGVSVLRIRGVKKKTC